MTDTIVSSGQTSSGLTLHKHDTLTILSGGTAIDTLAKAGATIIVSAGGTESATTLLHHAKEQLLSGSFTIATRVKARARATVHAGAETYADSVTGTEQVDRHGSAFAAVIHSGGLLTDAGSVTAATVRTGGTLTVLSGGNALADHIQGGTEIVSGGTASYSLVSGGGVQTVTLGTALATSVGAGGHQIVDGGTVLSTTILSGGTQTIAAGAIATGTTLQAGALLDIHGTATGAVLNSGASTIIHGGGTLTALGSGGYSNGGTITILSGGLATSLTVSYAVLSLTAGARTSAVTLYGGQEFLLSGATGGSGTTLLYGAQTIESGATGSASLFKAATLTVAGGGTARNEILEDRSTAEVSAGGLLAFSYFTSANLTVAAGGSASLNQFIGSAADRGLNTIYGNTLSSVLHSGTGEQVFSGGIASATQIDQGASAFIYSGGLELAAGVHGGTLTVSRGGLAQGTTLAGEEIIRNGGRDSAADVASGGLLVLDGGTALSATIESGGAALLLSGSLFHTKVKSGGSVYSTGVVVSSHGHVSAGTDLSGAIIGSGAVAYVLSGATLTSATLLQGGSIDLAGTLANTTVSGTYLTITATANSLTLDDAQLALGKGGFVTGAVIGSGSDTSINGGTLVGADISAGGELDMFGGSTKDTILRAGGTIYLPDFNYGSSAQFNSSNDTLTVYSYSRYTQLSVASTYANEQFVVRGGEYGTTITLTSAAQSPHQPSAAAYPPGTDLRAGTETPLSHLFTTHPA